MVDALIQAVPAWISDVSRPRTPIGTFGEISTSRSASGAYVARTRFRDWDGRSRLVQATAPTRRQSETELKAKLAERVTVPAGGDHGLTPDSAFADLAELWIDSLEMKPELSPGTRQLYRWNLSKLVLPHFGHLALREIGVARCDLFIKQQRAISYSRAKQTRNVIRQVFGLAVRYEILFRNPMESVERLHRPRTDPSALTPREVDAIRIAIRLWEHGSSASGPKPDGQLGGIVEVMLGTSARIGEVLALRRRDVDVTSPIPSIRITGTIVCPRGAPPHRQDHPKTHRSRRTVALPSFTSEAIRNRLVTHPDMSLDALLFASRNGTPLTQANVRRQLRRVLAAAGVEQVSPHMFRRTAATAVHERSGVDLAAELLGHADPRITVQHYIRRNEMVNPATADILDEVFSHRPADRGRELG